MVRQQGFEPGTYGLEVRCSIQLSYWRIVRKKKVLVVTLPIFVKTKHRPVVLSDIPRYPIVQVSIFPVIFTPGVCRVGICLRLRVEPPVQIPGTGQFQGCDISYRPVKDIPPEGTLPARAVIRIKVRPF